MLKCAIQNDNIHALYYTAFHGFLKMPIPPLRFFPIHASLFTMSERNPAKNEQTASLKLPKAILSKSRQSGNQAIRQSGNQAIRQSGNQAIIHIF